MAATTPNLTYDRRTGLLDRRHTDAPRAPRAAAIARAGSTEGIRVSWGGIWGGVLTAIGLLMLLAALGMAVGITAIDPQSTDGQTLGLAAGAWAGISLLIALFVGGMVSTRIGAIHDRATGFWEGGLVWIVTLLLMAYLATSGVTSLAGGAMSLMGTATRAAAPAAQSNPTVSGAIQDPAKAAAELKSRIAEAAGNGQVAQKAAEAKPAATRAAWMMLGGLVLSLLASIFGAMAGRRRAPPL